MNSRRNLLILILFFLVLTPALFAEEKKKYDSAGLAGLIGWGSAYVSHLNLSYFFERTWIIHPSLFATGGLRSGNISAYGGGKIALGSRYRFTLAVAGGLDNARSCNRSSESTTSGDTTTTVIVTSNCVTQQNTEFPAILGFEYLNSDGFIHVIEIGALLGKSSLYVVGNLGYGYKFW